MDPNPKGQVRDQAYPSEVAAQRPIGATRIQCPATLPLEDTASRGGENRVTIFNRELREGLGTSYPDNTDE